MRPGALAVALLLLPLRAWAQPFTFVTTPASDSVAVVDLASHTVVDTLPLGGLPSGCAVRPFGSETSTAAINTHLYVALSQSNSLAMVSLASGTVATVPVGASPAGVAVEAQGGRIYVANAGSDTVSVVDPRQAAVVATIAVGFNPLALVASGRRVYVANWGGKSVSVIDTVNDAVVATLPVGTSRAASRSTRARTASSSRTSSTPPSP